MLPPEPFTMFGGYTEVAAYYVNTPWPESGEGDGDGMEDHLPSDYTPQHVPPDPWHRLAACQDDFIMIAEFSEQEGPKPLIVIPKDGGGSFDLNDFSVRIMSVDFQTVSGSSFNMSEDTQIIMSETSNGLYAYVYHLTLYDYQARGFVRPFCMSYVTPHQEKLFCQFEDLSSQFKKVARSFKSGNLDLFVKDITHYLSDLHYTKERYMEREQSLCVEDGEMFCLLEDPVEEMVLQSVTLTGLDNLIREVQSILEATSNMLSKLEDLNRTSDPDSVSDCIDPGGSGDPSLEDPVELDNFRYSCSLQNNSPGLAKHWLKERERAGSVSQVLSSWTDKDSVYKPKLVRTNKKRFEKSLRTLHELCMYGAKDGLNRLRSLHKYFSRDLYTLQLEKTDAAALDPSCGLLTVGNTVLLNFLDGLHISRSLMDNDSDSTGSESHLDRKWLSNDTVASFHSADSFLSCLEDISPTKGLQYTPQIIKANSSTQGCVSTRTNEGTKFLEATSSNHYLSLPSPEASGLIFESCGHVNVDLSHVSSQPVKLNVVSSVDHVTEFNQSSMGYGVQKFVQQFPGSCHVIYSLLMGRPTVIFGSGRLEKDIRSLVNTLSMFIPGHSNLSRINGYHADVLTVLDITKYRLIGLCRADKRKLDHMIPSSVKRYVTILDIEKRAVWSPEYKGGLLSDIYSKKKVFTSEQMLVTFIHSILYDMAVKSYMYFHGFCLGCEEARPPSANSHLSSQTRVLWGKKSFNLMEKLHVNSQDAHIIQYFADVVKTQHKSVTGQPCTGCNTARLDHVQCSWIKL